MKRWIRRIVLLAVSGGGAVLFWKKRSSQATHAPESAWPPFESSTSASTSASASTSSPAATAAAATAPPADDGGEASEVVRPFTGSATATATTGASWVLPVDGTCPDGYPVKANDGSKIFHLPGGRSYDRTVPERCYATAEAAEADGYRRAKL